MRIRSQRIGFLALSICLVVVFACDARASAITWGFQGAVDFSQVPDIPVGTPVNVTWSFDAAQPNACGGSGTPGQGIYFGHTVTLGIGGLTYVTTNDIFTNHTNVSQGCGGPLFPGTELRLINWSGPTFPGMTLIAFWPCCSSPALLGVPASADGSLPSTPPANIFIQGPIFLGQGGSFSVTSQAQLAPEPSTVVLLGTGLLAALLKRLGSPRRSN